MVAELAIYTVVHQPRRLKLPAQPIPRGASIPDILHCLFDERMNERYFQKVAQYSYYPAVRMFLDLVRQGLRLSIGFSLTFLRQAAAWDPVLLDLFRELVAEENVEIIGVEPYHSFLFLLDLPTFVTRMQGMADEIERVFGKRPVVTDTTEMCMSATIYNALDAAGFRGALMDGRSWVMEWRESTHLYRYSDEAPYPLPLEVRKSRSRVRADKSAMGTINRPLRMTGRSADMERESGAHDKSGPYLLTRHLQLSDDVGYRFSNRSWSNYPLFADTYADWIANTRGDFVLLGWDFETFGEHHRQDSGIFEFMRALPAELTRRGVSTLTPSALIERYEPLANDPGAERDDSGPYTQAGLQQGVRSADCVNHLPLPIFPTTWAGSGGMEFFLGNSAQQTIFQLMRYVYDTAKLTENPDLLDVAIELAQSDNLHLIQWYGRSGSEADVSAYFTPNEWWELGAHRIIFEQQQVYHNALHAMEPYLPARLIRQARRKGKNKVPRRRSE